MEERIKVAIRIRPSSGADADGWKVKYDQSQARYSLQNSDSCYVFDHVFDPTASNINVYGQNCKDIIDGVMRGINGTIFAYGKDFYIMIQILVYIVCIVLGQTSSGKTFTMIGGGEQKGVLCLASEDIFTYICEHQERQFLIRASFIEIYNENLRDLLADSESTVPSIREDPRKGVFLESTEVLITDFDGILKVLRKGKELLIY
jgi:centromeric protein E